MQVYAWGRGDSGELGADHGLRDSHIPQLILAPHVPVPAGRPQSSGVIHPFTHSLHVTVRRCEERDLTAAVVQSAAHRVTAAAAYRHTALRQSFHY